MKLLIIKLFDFFGLTSFLKRIFYLSGINKRLYSEQAAAAIKMYTGILNKDYLVFDIGANMGNYSEAFMNLSAKVVAVEPQYNCYRFLKMRFKNAKNITILNAAIDNTAGEKILHISNSHTISSMSEEWISRVKSSNRFPDAKWEKKSVVKTITLDSLIETYGIPDYCKIDVEGYEYNVLSGLTQKIPLISIEYTLEHADNTKKCLEHLERIGKIQILFESDLQRFNNKDNWLSSEEALLRLVSNENKTTNGDLFIRM